MVTLSSRGAQPGADVTGLLYTPELPASDVDCITASEPYVPANVTRRANLPDINYDMIGLAPWLSPACVQSYLRAAREDTVRGFMFFLPNNETDTPPEAGSTQWLVADSNWRRENLFPVYAIPGQTGNILMEQSALYSKNMTEVPFGMELTEIYDSRDYVRLFVDIDTSGGSRLPSLWVFLLVVLAILFLVVAATSLSMHWLQRRRRRTLRRRVANGEVDLEALGIKRLTVPQSLLDKLPLYTYGSVEPVQQASLARETNGPSVARDKLQSADSSRPSSPDQNVRPTAAMARSTSYHPSPLQQPTCAICLDDYVPASDGTQGTIVRELPCHHIFHPECVDTFLRDSSSLCPICKRTALPKGYCPRVVTNAMVRRERMIRRIRPDADGNISARAMPPLVADTNQDVEPDSHTSRFDRLSTIGRRIGSAPMRQSQQISELPQPPDAALGRSASPSAQRAQTVQPADSATRREWARRRAEQMLGRQAPVDPDAEEAQAPGWKKALRNVFPGFGVGRRRTRQDTEGGGG